MNKCMVLIITGLILFCFVATGFSEEETDKTLSPYFFVESGVASLDHFPLEETFVTVNISGVMADVVVKQTYTNNGALPLNAKYIFPASTRATVHGLKMMINDEIIMAKIKERQAARKTFDTAKKKGKRASLLKQQRPNVFSMNVANLMPHDTIHIELQYTELLVPTDGTYEFVYPTVVGPRYSSQSEREASEKDLWIKNPYLKKGSAPRTRFNIETHVSTGMPIQDMACTSHNTKIQYQSESVARIMLEQPEDFNGNRDYILRYRLKGKSIQSGLLLYEDGIEKFFLLMVQPPERVAPQDIPGREYIFVVDVSGSMHGFPLNTSKKLLADLIKNLKPSDRFNVILFAGGSRMMAPSSLSATRENVDSALGLIDRERGGGGTELMAALEKAMKLPQDETVSRSIVIISDGYISAEKEVFQMIRKNLNRTNVFSFGIGSGVNRYLMEGIAKAGLGEPFVVTEPGEAFAAAEKFRNYIQSPVLTRIAVDYNGIDAYDTEPAVIPDLFAERPVIIFGKYRHKEGGIIQVTGKTGVNDYVRSFSVSETNPLKINHVLKYLWARTRIARLSDYNFEGHTEESRAEVTTLGITYNLLTAHTSFVAVHDVVVNPEGKSRDVNQPLPLPLHVSNLAVGKSVATVPEPDLQVLLIIVAIMACSAIAFRKGIFLNWRLKWRNSSCRT